MFFVSSDEICWVDFFIWTFNQYGLNHTITKSDGTLVFLPRKKQIQQSGRKIPPAFQSNSKKTKKKTLLRFEM